MLPGSGWVLRPNTEQLRLPPTTFDKVYPWILYRDTEPVTEIGDSTVPAALRKAEWAIAQGRHFSPQPAQPPARLTA
ncbi:hypothetical protein EV191_1203 [Tamaricihabitans halophyticus]|uniref:Uncharacterized protein n=1 Tax=Tamaricihabitans halophyticus TaxID=1262583 RepID=A0A4R2Q5S4_9PSEU|nr:hypothetical protein EV191_1203 [Tamaricihabitans halophyticus]